MEFANELLKSGTADPIKLAFSDPETVSASFIDSLDLSMVQEIKRGKDGAIEVKLVDKLRLAELASKSETTSGEDLLGLFLGALTSAAHGH